MAKYKVGDLVTATVTGIENYGIFVNINNEYTGLVHISEISYNFVKDVNNYAKIDEKILVKIIDIDEEKKRMKLNIKDIDYRMDKKNNKIQETPLGFRTLGRNLEHWISKKKRELQKNIMKKNK